jgi:putative transposase
MRRYRRRLPHWDAPGIANFITWRLHGSLPPERLFLPEHLSSGEAFAAWDRLLDRARTGPLYLQEPVVATLVSDQLRKVTTAGLCSIDAFVIMPNHVHVLWTPFVPIAHLIRQVKGPTAIEANRVLSRTGGRFWQEEYFDRTVRTDAEFARIRRYIEWNPVRAALAARPEEFPWSSAAAKRG